MRYAVVGIGINVAHERFPEELAAVATSLRLATGSAVDRELLLVELLRALDEELLRLQLEAEETADGEGVLTAGLLQRLAAASSWVEGKRVRVGEADGYTGVTAGLSLDGFLRVRQEDGTVRTVLSGGVRELDLRQG